MTPSFDLTTQPWISVVGVDRLARDESLIGVFRHAHEIREVVDSSPLVTCSLHRLLLAIIHRVTNGPATVEDWTNLMDRGSFESGAFDDYFGCWRDRFDLFHRERPFYQTVLSGSEYERSIANLLHSSASGNNPTLFDHTVDDQPPGLTAAAAARALVTFQAFAMGGLISAPKGAGKADRSADHAPLVGGAVCLAHGTTLFETLLLNLVRYNRLDEVPFSPKAAEDLPAWERPRPIEPRDRDPDFYVDYLTWQSRRISLIASEEDGAIVIRKMIAMKGEQFSDRTRMRGWEPMLSYRKNPKAKSDDEPWFTLGFKEERALWRDSLSLAQAVPGSRSRTKVADWLATLVGDGALVEGTRVPFDVYGLDGDKSKVVLWRHERLILPLAYLRDEVLVESLATALRRSEDASVALRQCVPRRDRPGAKEGDPLVSPADVARLYWSQLDGPARELIEVLADSRRDSGWDELQKKHIADWGSTVEYAAWRAFDEATGRLDAASKLLVEARGYLGYRLRKINKENAPGGVSL